MGESGRDKKAFISYIDLCQFTKMRFGLRDALSPFQRFMDFILSTVKWKYVFDYLDEIVIFSRTPEEHIKHTRMFLRLLKDADVALNLQ